MTLGLRKKRGHPDLGTIQHWSSIMPYNTIEIAVTESKRISAYSLEVIENRSEKFDCVSATIDVPWQQFLSTFIERFRDGLK